MQQVNNVKTSMSGVMRLFAFLILLTLIVASKAIANGCSGSQFSLTYSAICGCYQFCGGSGNSLLISDCDDIESLCIDWGDGSPSFCFSPGGQFPCHHYAPGTYTAVMRIEGKCHNPFSNQVCHIPQTVVVSPQNFLFEADFDTDTMCLGEVTNFRSTSVFDATILNRHLYWDFGDGTTDSGPLTSVDHYYTRCGAYDVMLVISGNQLCCPLPGNDTIIKRVYVKCPPNANSNALGDSDPYIYETSASVTMNEVCLGDVTNFNLTKSDSIISWTYTFADGGSSALLNPSHTYLYCSPFTPWVNVELVTTQGCTADLYDTAVVHCPVVANYAGITGTLCAGDCNGTVSINPSGGTPPYQIAWDNGQTTPTAINLCPDTYSVTVTDNEGCWDTLSLSVFSPNPFAGTVTATDIDCYGWLTGTAVIAVTGGTPPNTFYWSPGADTSAVNSGLSPGTYCVTATDFNGCTLSDCATINQATQIVATTTGVDAACGSCDGSATVAAAGGSGVFSYSWATNPAQTTANASNLCSGIYFVEVEDTNAPGCIVQASVSIGNSGAEPVNFSKTDISCSNACDGTATAAPAACANCINEWLDANGTPFGGNTTTITGLCAGDYTARVTNPATGCQSLTDFTIVASSPLTVIATPTGISCVGSCDGQISVVPTGANYTYQWFDANNNPIPGTAAVITGLCPGTYNVIVMDQIAGCAASATATVADHFFNGNRTNTGISCAGDCNASITVTATGSNSPFTFYVRDSSGVAVNSGSIAANLCADIYSILIVDAVGCSLTLPQVVIADPSPIVPVTASVDALCFGDCDGSASVTATGGTGAYSYQWANASLAPIPGAVFPTAGSLCAGAYNVQVRDVNNCASPWVPAVVGEPARLRDSMIITQPHCGNNGLGCVDLIVSGGTQAYGPFTWSGPNGFTASTEDICNIPAGQYTVLITDANGCVHAGIAGLITSPPLSIVSLSKVGWMEGGQVGRFDIRCFGDSTGAAIVTVTGGVPPYSYAWNGPITSTEVKTATADTVRKLPAGVYNISIADSSGCIADTVITITQPPPMSVSGTPVNVKCYGDATGSIDLNVSGGVPMPPQNYGVSWTYLTDTSVHIASIDTQLNNLLAGEYAVVVRDSYVCGSRDTITITQPLPLEISFSVINGNCSGSGNGSIHAAVTGGTGTYDYSWAGGGAADSLTNLSPGNYILTVTDSNMCEKIDTAAVIEPVPLAIDIDAFPATCFNGSDGKIEVTVTGGSPDYSYLWTPVTDTTEDLAGIPAGTYAITVTDQGGCTTDASASVNQPLLITNTVSRQRCDGDSLLVGGGYQTTGGRYIDTLQTTIGCDSVLYTDLSFVANFSDTIQPSICSYQTFSIGGSVYDESGTYIDTLTASGGCDSIVWTDLLVFPDIGLDGRPALDTFTLGVNEGIQIDIINNPGITIVDYEWDHATWLNCTDCNSFAIFSVQEGATYPESITEYIISATDENNCIDSTKVTIVFDAEANIYIPNAFSPNQDGSNDVFYVYGRGFTDFNLKIFNRWGELIFESFDQNYGWDGTYRGKLLPPGVFVYYVDVKFISGIAPPEYQLYRKGSVTLLR